MRWLLTGQEYDATEAHRIGLVQEVVEPGRQLDRAIELAEMVAEKSAPLGVKATLASAHRAHIERPYQPCFSTDGSPLCPIPRSLR